MTTAKAYTDDDEIGPIRFVEDFLPPPEQLVLRDDGGRRAFTLSRRSVDFMAEARRWQRMIRALVDNHKKRHRG